MGRNGTEETERTVMQIRREKEPEYQKGRRKKRIKISRDAKRS